MKKQSLLLAAGITLALASCQNEGASTGGFTEAQVDSIVNAKVSEQMMQMQMQNDSTINAMAAIKADSIVAAMKGGNTVTTVHKTTTTVSKNTNPTKKVEETKPTPTNPKDNRFNGSNNTSNKDSRFDDKAAQKAKEESTNKKADRFK